MGESLLVYLQIVTSILGFFLLVAGTVGGLHSFYLWIIHPKISLRFDETLTFDERLIPVRRRDEELPTKWVHIIVNGDKKTELKNVRAYVRGVWSKSKDGSLSRVQGFVSKLPLVWANTGGQTSVDVLVLEKARVDVVFYVMEIPLVLQFHTARGVAGTRTTLPTGNHVIQIEVVADNAKTGTIKLEISSKDDPEEDYGVKVRESLT